MRCETPAPAPKTNLSHAFPQGQLPRHSPYKIRLFPFFLPPSSPPRPSIHRCQRPSLSLPLPLFFCLPKRRHNALLSSRSFACCGCPSCPSERLRAYFSDLSAILGLISRQVTNPIATSSLAAGQPISITWQDDNKTPLLASFGPASIGLYAGNQQQQVCSPSIPFPRPLYAKSSLDSPANDCYQR
jgi:hypothetical protein